MTKKQVQPSDHMRDLFDALPGRFFITDRRAVALYSNKAMEERTGYGVGEIVGQRPSRLWGGQMESWVYEEMWDVIDRQRRPFVRDIINKRKQGEVYREKVSIAPVVGSERSEQYYIALMPAGDNVGKAGAFQQEFQIKMSRQGVTPTVFFDWVLPWLDAGEYVQSEIKKVVRESGKSLHHVLREWFVLPTSEQYKSRSLDRELVMRAKEHGEAFQTLFGKYHKDVYQYFIHRVGYDSKLCEDLVQDVFTKAFAALPKFQSSNASYRTYLVRVAHNLLVNYYRKKQASALEEIEDVRGESSEGLVQRMDIDFLWEKVENVSQIERSVLRMKYKDDMSVREIACALDKTENAVKLHLSRGRKKLKNMFGQTGA